MQPAARGVGGPGKERLGGLRRSGVSQSHRQGHRRGHRPQLAASPSAGGRGRVQSSPHAPRGPATAPFRGQRGQLRFQLPDGRVPGGLPTTPAASPQPRKGRPSREHPPRPPGSGREAPRPPALRRVRSGCCRGPRSPTPRARSGLREAPGPEPPSRPAAMAQRGDQAGARRLPAPALSSANQEADGGTRGPTPPGERGRPLRLGSSQTHAAAAPREARRGPRDPPRCGDPRREPGLLGRRPARSPSPGPARTLRSPRPPARPPARHLTGPRCVLTVVAMVPPPRPPGADPPATLGAGACDANCRSWRSRRRLGQLTAGPAPAVLTAQASSPPRPFRRRTHARPGRRLRSRSPRNASRADRVRMPAVAGSRRSRGRVRPAPNPLEALLPRSRAGDRRVPHLGGKATAEPCGCPRSWECGNPRARMCERCRPAVGAAARTVSVSTSASAATTGGPASLHPPEPPPGLDGRRPHPYRRVSHPRAMTGGAPRPSGAPDTPLPPRARARARCRAQRLQLRPPGLRTVWAAGSGRSEQNPLKRSPPRPCPFVVLPAEAGGPRAAPASAPRARPPGCREWPARRVSAVPVLAGAAGSPRCPTTRLFALRLPAGRGALARGRGSGRRCRMHPEL